MPKLAAAFTAVVSHARAENGNPLPRILGGRWDDAQHSALASQWSMQNGALPLAEPFCRSFPRSQPWSDSSPPSRGITMRQGVTTFRGAGPLRSPRTESRLHVSGPLTKHSLSIRVRCSRRTARPALQLWLIFACSGAAALRAQVPSPVGVVRLAPVTDTQSTHAQPPAVSSDNMLGRMTLGVVGAVGGALMGGVLGIGAVMGCHDEWCELSGAVPGAIVGSVLGSLLAASEPSFSSACQSSERFKSAVKGALGAALIGGVVGTLKGSASAAVGAFGGMSVGSGVGAAICKPKAH